MASGGVVKLGREVDVETPFNRAVADILSVHANGHGHHRFGRGGRPGSPGPLMVAVVAGSAATVRRLRPRMEMAVQRSHEWRCGRAEAARLVVGGECFAQKRRGVGK
jgi:hypothetical protein